MKSGDKLIDANVIQSTILYVSWKYHIIYLHITVSSICICYSMSPNYRNTTMIKPFPRNKNCLCQVHRWQVKRGMYFCDGFSCTVLMQAPLHSDINFLRNELKLRDSLVISGTAHKGGYNSLWYQAIWYLVQDCMIASAMFINC